MDNELNSTAVEVKRQPPTLVASVFLIGALVACERLDVPIYSALGGWITYYTRGHTKLDRLYNLACAVTGLGLGVCAYSLIPVSGALPEVYSLSVVLVMVVGSIYLMQLITAIENALSYFLGVLVLLAYSLPPTFEVYLTLTLGIVIGALAGACSKIVLRMT